MWSNGIVPVAVEIITQQVDLSPLFVGDLAADGIPPAIQSAGDFQACRRGRFRDQVHHGGIVGQRLTSPVRADEREEPMLNLVPFAGTRRKMADRDGETKFIGETLKLPFPQAQPRTIASPRICRDQQPFSLGVRAPSFSPPPCPDRGHCKGRGVMVSSDIDETPVSRQFVNAVGMRSRDRRVWEIVTVDLWGLAIPSPLLSSISIVSDQFLLLGVHGNDRLGGAHLLGHAGVDVFKLRIAIRMLLAFNRLAITLQAIAHPMQQSPYQSAACGISELGQFQRQPSRALAGPAQRRLRIAARERLDQTLQLFRKVGLMLDTGFAPTSGPANSAAGQNVARRDLTQSDEDRTPRNPCRACHQRDAAVSMRTGFRGGPDAPCMLVETRGKRSELLPNCSFESHAIIIIDPGLSCNSYFVAGPNGIHSLLCCIPAKESW